MLPHRVLSWHHVPLPPALCAGARLRWALPRGLSCALGGVPPSPPPGDRAAPALQSAVLARPRGNPGPRRSRRGQLSCRPVARQLRRQPLRRRAPCHPVGRPVGHCPSPRARGHGCRGGASCLRRPVGRAQAAGGPRWPAPPPPLSRRRGWRGGRRRGQGQAAGAGAGGRQGRARAQPRRGTPAVAGRWRQGRARAGGGRPAAPRRPSRRPAAGGPRGQPPGAGRGRASRRRPPPASPRTDLAL